MWRVENNTFRYIGEKQYFRSESDQSDKWSQKLFRLRSKIVRRQKIQGELKVPIFMSQCKMMISRFREY